MRAVLWFLFGALLSLPPHAQAPPAGNPPAPNAERTFDLKGKVSDPDGEPLAKITVEIYVEPAHTLAGKAVTDLDGRFQIPSLPSTGTATIRVSGKDCYTLVKKNVDLAALQATSLLQLSTQCCEKE